jgi:hypothetical protein
MPIWVACIVFIIGTTLQTASFHLPQFAIGRFVVGLGGMQAFKDTTKRIIKLTLPL